jgi:hypothetical protein
MSRRRHAGIPIAHSPAEATDAGFVQLTHPYDLRTERDALDRALGDLRTATIALVELPGGLAIYRHTTEINRWSQAAEVNESTAIRIHGLGTDAGRLPDNRDPIERSMRYLTGRRKSAIRKTIIIRGRRRRP